MQSTPFHRISRTSLFVVGIFVSSAWGCAHLPKTGVEATGEPLNVEVRTETHTYTTQAKVGEVVNKDSSGRVVGTSEVYENRTGTYDVTRWQAFQGDTPIDDQDLFKIGGDLATAKEIADMRQSGMTMNKVGIGMAIGGGVAALGGFILANALSSPGQTTSSPAFYVGYGGLLTASVGGVLAFVGLAKVKREHPFDDPARANAVAKKYNQSIGAGAGPAAQDDEEEEEEKPKPPPPPKAKKKKKKKPVNEDDE